MTITIDTEVITPEAAAKYLKLNVNNRNLRPAVVERYARDITNGEWRLTGDAIRFNCDGSLLDGQHRLAGIVKAGKPVETFVIRGIDQHARDFMDTGVRRSFADVIHLRGYKNRYQLAAQVAWIWRYENDNMVRRQAPTFNELLEVLEGNTEEIIRSSDWISNRAIPFRGAKTALGAIHYYTSAKMPGEADAFFTKLRDGENLEKGDPLYACRRYLETNNNSAGSRIAVPVVVHGIIIKAFNAYIDGRKITTLRFVPGGSFAEPFPQIVTEYPGVTS